MLLWAYIATVLNTRARERKTKKEEVSFELWPEGGDNMYKAKYTHRPLLFYKVAPFYRPKMTTEFTDLLFPEIIQFSHWKWLNPFDFMRTLQYYWWKSVFSLRCMGRANGIPIFNTVDKFLLLIKVYTLIF